jgi:hypothetical protein
MSELLRVSAFRIPSRRDVSLFCEVSCECSMDRIEGQGSAQLPGSH